MKTIYALAIVVTLITTKTVSQPTLTDANTSPVDGDKFLTHELFMYYPASITYGGAQQTWDVSSYVSIDTFITTYVDPSVTPYSSLFPTANIASTIYANDYSFLVSSPTGLSFTGSASQGDTTIYTDDEKFLEYPFTYLNSFADEFAFYNSSDFSHGAISAEADGYGTLISATGTFDDVLRVHSSLILIDTSGFGPDTVTEEVYQWYEPGIHEPVCTYAEVFLLINTFYILQYSQEISTNIISAMSIADVAVYPNPATDFIRVTTSSNESSEITIYDLTSRKVMEQKFVRSALLHVDQLPGGVYTFEVREGNKVIKVGKVIKE